MMDLPESRARLVQQESNQLTRYLRTLPPSAWGQPSACKGWQVQDVVAHLAGGAEAYAQWVSRGLEGYASPTKGFPVAGTVNGASSAEGVARRAVADRKRLGDALLSTFIAQDVQLNQLFARVGPQEWDRPCYHPARVLPARGYVDLRMLELALHSWDIRSNLEPSAHLSAESLRVVIELIPELLGWLFQPGPRLPRPVRYRFQLTGVVPGTNDIVVEGHVARMEPAGRVPADVTIGCDAETFLLLMYGRLTLEAATAAGQVVADGNMGLVAQFGRWFTGA